jgi:putative aldouronate transport system substrate-binding protein
MLPLFKQYFQAAGFKDSAPLIIPAAGYFATGELATGFGVMPYYYLEDGKVKYGPMEDGYYNYLAKMKEWYQKGYIYKDFASRTNDLFYLPNTALTYGGAAGAWFGMPIQLGTKMSMPDKGLNVNVKAAPDPLDQAHGIKSAPTNLANKVGEFMGGTVISSKCKDIERLLSSLDWLYSKEGSYFKSYGLDQKNVDVSELYKKYNLTGWTTDSNGKPINPTSIKDGAANKVKDFAAFVGFKLPGVNDGFSSPLVAGEEDFAGEASVLWNKYDNDTKRSKLPGQLYRTPEEDAKYTKNQSTIDDYVNTMTLKFILNSTELNQTTWKQFKDQLVKDGVKDNIAIMQAACDRYNKR